MKFDVIGVLFRLLRHMLLPLVVLVTQRGWLPEEASSDIIEFLLIAIVSIAVLGWSYLREAQLGERKVKEWLHGPN